MNHLRSAWAESITKQAFDLPPDIRGYPIPHGGQLHPSKPNLDPDVFDAQERMRPYVRQTLLALLACFWDGMYPDWASWSKVYLSGSLASYWWHNKDTDILVGIDYPHLIQAHPEFALMSETAACSRLNADLRPLVALTGTFSFPPADDLINVAQALGCQSVSALGSIQHIYQALAPAETPEGLNGAEVTYYVNDHSYDISFLNPYAAYDISEDKWALHPSRFDKLWGPKQYALDFWLNAADVADEIKAAAVIKDPAVRQEDARAIYDRIHSGRHDAFSPGGGGVLDRRAMLWVVLSRWGMLEALERAAFPDRAPGHPAPLVAFRKGQR